MNPAEAGEIDAALADPAILTPPKTMLWVSYVVGILPCLLLLVSAAMKFLKPEGFDAGMEHLGWSADEMFWLGIVEIAVVVVYLIPRTAVLGAILIAAYMGGAVATHVRVGDPFWIQMPLGVLVWFSLWLRDGRVKGLIPLRG